MGQLVWAKRLGPKQLAVVQGDLTEETTDAIVNAANSQLAHGGGLAAAILRKGGQEIQEESWRLAPVKVGEAVVTGAGRLSCRFVIHAVGPRWGEGQEEAKLRQAVRSALARAEERGLRSLAMPAISTGIFGYPKGEGCEIIAQECWQHLQGEGFLQEIRLVALDGETVEHFLRACEKLTGQAQGYS